MKTKWGNAKIDKDGYYRITSGKEGNHRQFLHRLIWEDFWKTEVPKGYVIHHKNGDKLCNCILNLQLMRVSDHHKLHNCGENNPNYGKSLSDEHKRKISDSVSNSKNTSGYFRVSKHKNKNYKQGFRWEYSYIEDGKKKQIVSVSLDELKKKVKYKGLIWKKLKSGEF